LLHFLSISQSSTAVCSASRLPTVVRDEKFASDQVAGSDALWSSVPKRKVQTVHCAGMTSPCRSKAAESTRVVVYGLSMNTHCRPTLNISSTRRLLDRATFHFPVEVCVHLERRNSWPPSIKAANSLMTTIAANLIRVCLPANRQSVQRLVENIESTSMHNFSSNFALCQIVCNFSC
jgi:hypothetical protein